MVSDSRHVSVAEMKDMLRSELGFAGVPLSTTEHLLEVTGEWMEAKPRMPALVGSNAAAKMLGVNATHLSRLRERLPEQVQIEGSVSAFLKEDVRALANELNAERAARARRREATG